MFFLLLFRPPSFLDVYFFCFCQFHSLVFGPMLTHFMRYMSFLRLDPLQWVTHCRILQCDTWVSKRSVSISFGHACVTQQVLQWVTHCRGSTDEFFSFGVFFLVFFLILCNLLLSFKSHSFFKKKYIHVLFLFF